MGNPAAPQTEEPPGRAALEATPVEAPKPGKAGDPGKGVTLVPFHSGQPRLVAVYPGTGATDVPHNSEIRLRFDQPMDPHSVGLWWERAAQAERLSRGKRS